MIQRIQTIFFFLAGLTMLSLFTPLMSLMSVSGGDMTSLKESGQSMMDDGIFEVTDHLILLILVVVAILLSLAAIFLFRNRPLQKTLGRIALVAAILIIVLAAVFFYQDYTLMDSGQYEITVEYGVLAPVAFIVFIALALRYVSKDDKLVNSMDRLR